MTAYQAKESIRSFERFCRAMEEELGTDHDFTRTWLPLADVKEDKNSLAFIVELPGVKEEDVEVSYNDGQLDIRGTCRFPDEANKADYVRIERHFGPFHRSFRLDVPIRVEAVTVEFAHDLLTIRLPKCATPTPSWTYKGKLARRCTLPKRQCRPKRRVSL